LQFWQATPHTGLAVINDTCTANEYVHVKYKETAGRRLSLLARAIVYGEQVECSGPVYQSVKFDGAKATLTFTHVGDGLAAKVPVDPEALTLTAADLGGDLTAKGGELRGFTIAGADKKFVPARAEIQGDTVVVSSEQIANPVAVRYLWCRWPALWTDTTLYNKNGLPAPPFRTDDVATPVTVAVPGVPRTIIPKMMPGAPRHAELVKLAQAGGVDVMFLGDSITEFWRRAGKAVWAANFAPLEAANFGVAGEGTQSVLWRLQNGELEGIHPKVVVLLIGTNNTNEKPADIALGVKAVIAEIQQRSPGTRVLLMGIFPRDGQPGAPSRAKIAQANAILATYAHADDPAQVVYMDIGARFLNADGTMNKDLMPDTLHPSEQGYQVWADAILDTVKRLR
jgi:N-acetylglucosamine-6-sulfatase